MLLSPAVEGDSYPVEEIDRKLESLTAWLLGRDASSNEDDARWANALMQVSAFRRLCAATRLNALQRPMIRRLLRHALDETATMAVHGPQAGLTGVADPGAVVGPVQRIVWWNFTERSAPTVRLLPLTKDEGDKLNTVGAALPDPGRQAEQFSAAWRRPLLCAQAAALLVCPEFGADGEPEYPHPLWDEVVAGLEASRQVRIESNHPCGVTSERPVLPLFAPHPKAEWRIERSDALQLPDRFSPTSIDQLIANPLYWVLRYAGRLEAGRSEGLPGGVLMMGRLAHEILGRLLSRARDSEIPSPHQAATEAARLFDEEGPRRVAEFFMAGQERECAELRRHTMEAARDLFRHLGDVGARVAAVEANRESAAEGINLRGRPDLQLTNPAAVLDIKWGRTGDRRQELADGAASQLAIYGQMIGSTSTIGYYIIRDQALVVRGEGFPHAETVDGPAPEEIWRGVHQALDERFEQLRKGLIVDTCAAVEGNEPPDSSSLIDGKLVLAPQMKYSEFSWISEGRELR